MCVFVCVFSMYVKRILLKLYMSHSVCRPMVSNITIVSVPFPLFACDIVTNNAFFVYRSKGQPG